MHAIYSENYFNNFKLKYPKNFNQLMCKLMQEYPEYIRIIYK